MSDSPTEPTAQSPHPKAEIRPSRRLSIVWVIPLAVAVVAGWIAYKAVSDQGPSITITFKTAEGLEAGKTKIMYKGVQAGTVDSIDISEDLELAVVHATMAKQVKHHLNEGTQFWVVRPEVSLTGITGLSTLVSGPYIAIQPGDGKRQRAFKGLSQPPLDLETGTRFGLKADKLGTLHVSAPIHHHGLKVGKILEFDLAKDDSGLDIQILIYQPYDQLVRTNSLFWNTSGIDLNLRNLFDASLRVGSFESLVAGGIAFANPAGPAEAAPAETVFELHAIRPGAVDMNDVEEATEFKVILTAEALGGVEEGNAVLYREIQIGTVRKTQLNAAADGVEIHLGIAPAHSGLVRTDSVFWNASGVKLNLGDLVDASVEIESLKSLLAGGVALANPSDPGPQAESGTTYKLQAKRPEALFRQKTASDGLHIVLRSEVQGSVKLDDPILYREVEVGKVMEVELSDDASFVALKVAIEPRYAPLVRSHSVFWNASGIHASFGLFSGADIDIESLSALLRGGIAFATPKEGGKAVANGATFQLHSEAKKEWQSWAPHIRLPKQAAEQDATAANGSGAAQPAEAAATQSEATPTAEQEAATTSGETAPLPTAVAVSGGHVSTAALSQALAKLGFTNIGNLRHAGAIAHADADWYGEPVKLRIDTRTGRIEQTE
jgi:paraquat-inducible protein B